MGEDWDGALMPTMEHCQMCGEGIAVDEWGLQLEDEVGEFWNPETESSLWGHASCGLERGLEIA